MATLLPDQLRPHLTLALVPGLGPRLTAALLDHFGSYPQILQATEAELLQVPKIGNMLARRFVEAFHSVDVQAEWDLICRHQVELSLLGTDSYPNVLMNIPDAPTLLYRRGEIVPGDQNAVGIVGSRACTHYGLQQAEKIAANLARAGWTVVSGLARGIDGAAHKGALQAGGRTIAVLAGGLSEIYPREHTDLAEQCSRQGAVITETPMTVDPQPGMFPARNRIISGLSRGIVVIEANLRSGALITATHAAEQGREVFVLPGNVDSPASAGCLELIRKGARLVRGADDLLEDLVGIPRPDPVATKATTPSTKAAGPTLFDPEPPPPVEIGPPPGLDDLQLKIWQALGSSRHVDELVRELELPAGELTMHLMKLEMKRALRRLPGNYYQRR